MNLEKVNNYVQHIHKSEKCMRPIKEAPKGFLQLMYVSGQLKRKNSCF